MSARTRLDRTRAHAARWKNAAKQYRALFRMRAQSCEDMHARWDQAELDLRMAQMALRNANRRLATVRAATTELAATAREVVYHDLGHHDIAWGRRLKNVAAVAQTVLDDDLRADGQPSTGSPE